MNNTSSKTASNGAITQENLFLMKYILRWKKTHMVNKMLETEE